MGNSTYIAPANATDLMTGNLDSLANGANNIGATAIDNSTNRYFYAIFELALAAVDLNASTNPAVELYLVPSYDGATYADAGTDASTTRHPPAQYLVAVMGLDPGAASVAHKAVSPHVILDPIKYTPVVVNETGQNFAASGNTLKVKTYTATTA